MFSFKGLSYPIVCRGLIEMNARIYIGARAGLVLFAMAYHFAPGDLFFSKTGLICFAILVEVTLANFSLKQFGERSLAGGRTLFFRTFFGVHAAAYAGAFGYGCAWVLLQDQGGQYGVSLTATLFCASAVAVSSFAFDLLLVGIFLVVIMAPAIYVSFFLLPHAGPLGTTCAMTTIMFFYIGYSIRRGQIATMQSEETIKAQAVEISRSHNLFTTTLNSIDEVFLTIDLRGLCFGNVSRRGEELLGLKPVGLSFADVLRLAGSERATAERWFAAARTSLDMFEKLRAYGPARWESGPRVFQVRYSPMVAADGSLDAIIMTMTDVTAQVQAQRAADQAEGRAAMILAISEHRSLFSRFVTELGELLGALAAGRQMDVARVRQHLHTAKGTARLLELRPVADEINAFEMILREARVPEAEVQRHADHAARFLRAWLEVEATILKKLKIFNSDELSVSRARVDLVRRSVGPAHAAAFDDVIRRFWASGLSDALVAYQPHVARVARRLAKRAILEVDHGGAEILLLDETHARPLRTLVHVFNNAVDHGIETAPERVLAGKSEVATIRALVSRTATGVCVEVRDDGRGIDVVALRRLLDERGEASEALDDARVIERIFDAGVTTKAQADDLSGHGIGLNALYEAVRDLAGEIKVTTELGRGTTFHVAWSVPADALVEIAADETLRAPRAA